MRLRAITFQWVLTDSVLAHLKCLPIGDDDDSEKQPSYFCRSETLSCECFYGYKDCYYRDWIMLIPLFWKRRGKISESRNNFSITIARKHHQSFFNYVFIVQLNAASVTLREKHSSTGTVYNLSANAECWIFYRGLYWFPYTSLVLRSSLQDWECLSLRQWCN